MAAFQGGTDAAPRRLLFRCPAGAAVGCWLLRQRPIILWTRSGSWGWWFAQPWARGHLCRASRGRFPVTLSTPSRFEYRVSPPSAGLMAWSMHDAPVAVILLF